MLFGNVGRLKGEILNLFKLISLLFIYFFWDSFWKLSLSLFLGIKLLLFHNSAILIAIILCRLVLYYLLWFYLLYNRAIVLFISGFLIEFFCLLKQLFLFFIRLLFGWCRNDFKPWRRRAITVSFCKYDRFIVL